MTKDEAIMRKVYKLAFDGQPWAVQFIADRKEGKPHQSIDITEHERPEYNGNDPEGYLSDRLSQRQGI